MSLFEAVIEFLFIHGRFCPIFLIRLIGQKSLPCEKKLDYSKFNHDKGWVSLLSNRYFRLFQESYRSPIS